MDNLIFQIQRDNEYAFKQLYQEYYAKVVTFIAGIIKNGKLPETWHRMYLSISGLTGKRWMFHGICRTIFLSRHVMRPLII